MVEANGTSRRPLRRLQIQHMVNSVKKALLDKQFPIARNMVGHLVSILLEIFFNVVQGGSNF